MSRFVQMLAVVACATASSAVAALVISASPAAPVDPTETFNITWDGAPNAESTDWIAAYCVGAPVSANQAWAYVDVSPNWVTGSGSMSLVATMSGCEVEFRMYRDPSPYTLMGASNVVRWAGGNVTARHVRIAYGVSPQTQATVSWTSSDATTTAVLLVGTAPGIYDLPSVTAAAPVTYLADDSCGAPSAWSHPGYFHHALITGLSPATRYYVLPTQNGTRGSEATFVTAKPTGSSVATRFAVYGDMYISQGTGAVDTAAHLSSRISSENDIDFIAHIGDLSYGEGNVAVWETFMYDYTGDGGGKDPSGARRMWSPPFWNGGGDSGGECGVPTSRRFRMPANGNGVFWYSFAVGNVHIAMVSSEHDPSPGSPMGDWLAQNLAAVDRSVTPWLLLGIHRPLVETEAYASDFAVAAGLRAILEPLLWAQKVDAVLSGHYHSFQRSCTCRNLTCVDSGGILHYTTGAAGASLDDITVYPSNYIEKTILGRYGYSIVTTNATSMTLQFYANDVDVPVDEVTLTK